eukprot:scaffold6550_cov131-Isochrysis_galbana.AAC.9
MLDVTRHPPCIPAHSPILDDSRAPDIDRMEPPRRGQVRLEWRARLTGGRSRHGGAHITRARLVLLYGLGRSSSRRVRARACVIVIDSS